MDGVWRDAGSFRDPRGTVFVGADAVFRTVASAGAADYERARDAGLIDALSSQGLLLECAEVDRSALGDAGRGAAHVLSQPRLPFVSYPYEWCFSALRDAALLHLELHLRCLERGFTLCDASAYNVQLAGAGCEPVFIDVLSIRPYRDGEIWAGHRQFCEQFLNPLLLEALCGVSPNAWYRGSLEGIPVESLSRLVPLRHRLSLNVLKHVILPAAFQRASAGGRAGGAAARVRLPLAALQGMLSGLRRWIEGLEPRRGRSTAWARYSCDNTYTAEEAENKAAFVREFCTATRPALLCDLGCNTGEYAAHALAAGAGRVIGIDADAGAVEAAYRRARGERLAFLPLQMALANPSPSQGWAERERQGLDERTRFDAVLALALVHHLAIACNVPLPLVVEWLLRLAPAGVVEFVPKDDPMVRELLRLREDVFEGYSEAAFERELGRRTRVVRRQPIGPGGRTLYWFAPGSS